MVEIARQFRWPSFVVALALGLCLVGGLPSARAVTHESEEVQAVIEKALGWLGNQSHSLVGGKCLVGLAFKKNGRDSTHPKVKEALDAVLGTAVDHQNPDNYNLGLMIIFLCEMEDDKLKPNIQKMLDELYRRQKQNGGWGYAANGTGDTSQTQYAVLAIWMAERRKFDVPIHVIEKAINWLVRTQDPSGGWGYQGNDPGPAGGRIKQEPLTVSLTSAALGSLYILTDLVTLPGGELSPEPVAGGPKLPPALQLAEDKKAAQDALRRRPVSGVDGARVRKAMQDGKAWMKQYFTLEPHEWKHYALYAYERYESFREVLEKDKTLEPKWYNDVFANLKKSQQSDGSWEGQDTPMIATAFSVLVLCRSTKKAIKVAETLGEGLFVGGMGLPPDVVNIREKDGQVIVAPHTGSIDDLLSIIDDKDNPSLANLAETGQVLKLDEDATKRVGQITKLRGVVSAGNAEARLVAVRSLGAVRNLENVPILLFALSDQDARVVREADRGLRRISRKFDGVTTVDALGPETRQALKTRWRQWFLSIKPDAELLD